MKSESGGSNQGPRAVIHKRILDAAEANPERSIEGLSKEISGASPELVERVLDQYGDPAGDEEGETDERGEEHSADDSLSSESDDVGPTDHSTDSNSGSGSAETTADERTNVGDDSHEAEHEEQDTRPEAVPDSDGTETPKRPPMSPSESPPRLDELTEAQREVLEAIDRRPEATQAELADELGVSTATVNKRVNAIDGFEWSEREAFVADAVDTAAPVSDGGTTTNGSIEMLEDRVGRLEDRIEATEDESNGAFTDPELVAKVVKACVESDAISEEEEVQIIGRLLGRPVES